MSDEPSRKLRLEIGHVLFLDIVGYSKLLINEQSEQLQKLKEIVRATEQFRVAEAEGKLLRLPAGDGGALVFRTNPEAPVLCAQEISKGLKVCPELRVRMGIHSGPVNEVTDLNEQANMAGAGINFAQRVMDCGDAGHILLSKHVADDIDNYPEWRPYLHDLGESEVKHGVRLHLFNLYGDGFGNPAVPGRVQGAARLAHKSRTPWLIAAMVMALAVFAAAMFWSRAQRSSAPSSSAAPDKSIAVLPFENLSSEKENAYFANGVQDEILTDLARIADLKVISRTSVMQYKTEAQRDLREIGQQLGVAHLLEGSVQRAPNRIRVNAQLIDARTDAHLWANTYDRDLADVFAIQSEIAKAIADQLQAKISTGENASISQAPTADLEANSLYVKAKLLEIAEPQEQSLREAVKLADQAVARDPQFVLAHCLLGRLHLTLYWGGYDHSEARRQLANAAIQNAVRLAPDAGEVHLALARDAYWGFRDYDRARAELDLARRTLPNDAHLLFLSAAIDRRQGRWAEATRNFERTVELDPRNFEALANAAGTYNALRRYDEATSMFNRALELRPDDIFARILRARQAFDARADTRPLEGELASILKDNPGAAAEIADISLSCALVKRDAAAVRQALDAISPNGISPGGNFVYPHEWFAGFAARTLHDAATAQTAFTAARAITEKLVQDQPDVAPAWSLLGRIDAALGRKERNS